MSEAARLKSDALKLTRRVWEAAPAFMQHTAAHARWVSMSMWDG